MPTVLTHPAVPRALGLGLGCHAISRRLLVAGVAASHGVLDAFTNGGLGIAFLWPWSAHRYFFPIQMIEVSPLGLRPFLSAWGLNVLLSELLWVWIPCTLLGWALVTIGHRIDRQRRRD
jgi:inner membrane protein